MRARLNLWIDRIWTSFWFLPLVMLALAWGLAILLLYIDDVVDPGMKATVTWAYTGGPEGARSLLSTIAGAMITAASVTFSLASVALSIASQQYGSRVLRNYMRDRITQVLLGTFISHFIYSVLVVRDIRGSDFGGGFVPAISVTVAIALSLVSLILLVFFVHHISTSVKASHQLRMIGKDLRKAAKEHYPGTEDQQSDRASLFDASRQAEDLGCEESGYLQTVDLDTLLSVASRKNLVIEIGVKPGDHCVRCGTIAKLFGDGDIDDADRSALRNAFVFGGERTPAQDIRYQFQQLAEIIIRSMSPAINDPFIAITGIDELASGVAEIVRRPRAAEQKRDGKGKLRLIVPVPEIAEILETTVGHIAIYAAGDRFVMQRLQRVLELVKADPQNPSELNTLARLRLQIADRLRELNRADRRTGTAARSGSA